MFIQTEQTPNPASLKFLPGCEVMLEGSIEFNSPEKAVISPLAQNLFKIEHITTVFLGTDFITITKTNDADWEDLKTRVLGTIMEHFTTNQPIINEEALKNQKVVTDTTEEDSEIITQIKELIDTRIRPVVAQDGGDIVFSHFEEGIVYLHLRGACAGCPGAAATLKNGVENLLKHFIPEVEEVRSTD